jgi:hypothetical protein
VVVKDVRTSVVLLGGVYVWLCPVPVGAGGETDDFVGEDEEVYELLEVDPVAQELFPYHASLGMLLAAAEPTRAAKKNEARMIIVLLYGRLLCKTNIVAGIEVRTRKETLQAGKR